MKYAQLIVPTLAIVICFLWMDSSASKLNNRILNQIQAQERTLRDSLTRELTQIRSDREPLLRKVDSLTVLVHKSDSIINRQITILRYETYKNLKDYRDSTNSALLNRLRTR